MNRLLLFTLLGSIGYYVIRELRAINKISSEIIGVNFEGGLLSLTIGLKVKVSNPSNINIQYQGMRAGVFLNNELIGDIDSRDEKIIPANLSTTLNIPVMVNPIYALSKIIEMWQPGSLLEIRGSIKADSFNTAYYESFKL